MESRIEELKRYVRFSPEDATILAAFKTRAAPHFQRIAEEFYDRIREHEEAHAVFENEAQIRRLQSSLVRWLERLLEGTYDERYFEETSLIGRAHVRVGLPQRYMFTAMALIRVSLMQIAQDDMKLHSAICRLLDIELAIMLDAYRDDWMMRIEKAHALDLARIDPSYAELFPAAIVAASEDGIVRAFNGEVETLSGHPREDVVGKPFLHVVLGEDPDPDHVAVIEEVLAGRKKTARLDAPMRTRAGHVRDMRWVLSHVPKRDIAIFAVGTDLTEEREATQRAKQQEKLAAVGMLAAGLAHEIRNPLNGAQLHLAFLERALKKQGITDQEMIDAVHVVGDEIQRLAKLVTEFLDFARPHALQRSPTSVSALCKRVRELALSDANQAHVDVQTDTPGVDITIHVDRDKLEQVLLNLVMNSIEALAPRGGGHVIVRARKQPRACILEVEDDGPGIASDNAPVFDAFYSTKPNGTGLGLAIALRVISDHGGSISFTSHPGKTRFVVTLPWSPTAVGEHR